MWICGGVSFFFFCFSSIQDDKNAPFLSGFSKHEIYRQRRSRGLLKEHTSYHKKRSGHLAPLCRQKSSRLSLLSAVRSVLHDSCACTCLTSGVRFRRMISARNRREVHRGVGNVGSCLHIVDAQQQYHIRRTPIINGDLFFTEQRRQTNFLLGMQRKTRRRSLQHGGWPTYGPACGWLWVLNWRCRTVGRVQQYCFKFSETAKLGISCRRNHTAACVLSVEQHRMPFVRAYIPERLL